MTTSAIGAGQNPTPEDSSPTSNKNFITNFLDKSYQDSVNTLSETANTYSKKALKTLSIFASLYCAGKLCQKSPQLRKRITKGFILLSLSTLAKSDPYSGILSFTTTVLGGMQTNTEKEISNISKRIVQISNEALDNSEFFGLLLANFAQIVDQSIDKVRSESSVPLLLTLSSSSLMIHSLLDLPNHLINALEEPSNRLATMTAILSGSLAGGHFVDSRTYSYLKPKLCATAC
ncbi:MAG: hypothetical protein GWP59_05030 [Chlamydiales bacterium]|nr:hypothetical protein [Chlamydiales bacterium]NCF71048.1 hypothetical protein [Chlamydiales bacterium]